MSINHWVSLSLCATVLCKAAYDLYSKKSTERLVDERIKKIADTILSCPEAKKLYDDATKKGWKIELVKKIGERKGILPTDVYQTKDGRIFNFPFPALCNDSSKTVFLSDDLPDDKLLSLAIFELTNCASQVHFKELHRKAELHDISCEDYVEKTEFIEYQGTILHNSIIDQGVELYGWSKSLMARKFSRQSFEISYSRCKFSPHAFYYREQWEQLTGKKSEYLQKLKSGAMLIRKKTVINIVKRETI